MRTQLIIGSWLEADDIRLLGRETTHCGIVRLVSVLVYALRVTVSGDKGRARVPPKASVVRDKKGFP